MTFLWKKKSRLARMSHRFMTDLHSPSKNCGSLVIENGFPTSLVDLAVKNKNRLKSISSRRTQDDDDQDWEISDPVLISPLPPHLVCPEACANLVEFESRRSGYSSEEIEVVEQVKEGEIIDNTKTHGEYVELGKNAMFVNVLKVLVVVVLGLSVRRFVAAVVMSVVLLLLLELIKTRLISSSMCCSDAWAHCQGITNRVRDFFRIKCLFRNKSKVRLTFDAKEGLVISEGEIVEERSVDSDDCSLPDKIREIKGTALIDDDGLVVAANTSSVAGCSLNSGIRMRNTESRRYEYFGGPGQEDHKHDPDYKPKSRFMKMIVPKKPKNPKTGKKNTVSSAILFGTEQLPKENHWKDEDDEIQSPTAKEQFANGETRRK